MNAPELPSPPYRIAVYVFCAGVLGAQLYGVLNAYHDPLKRFGYQPFAESTVWRAEIDTVDVHGEHATVTDGFAGYRWSDLVRERVGHPFHTQATSSGIGASLYFLQRALDYVADHTPNDHDTQYLEARVWYRKNRQAERWVTLRSKRRLVSPP
ncbi:MAG: hypothetical protein ABW321_04500 [Polyangiales bacterium]